MSGDSFGTQPGPRTVADTSANGFPSNLFQNKTGLRAGWRLLIFAAICFVALSGSTIMLGQFFRPEYGVFSPLFQFLSESSSFLAAFFAAWVMSFIEQRKMGLYGLPLSGAFGKLFWQGTLFGFLEIGALIGFIAAFHGYSFGSVAEHGLEILKWAAFWGAFFVVVGLFEEFFFRGYAMRTLTDGIGYWPAAILLSLFFGLVHKQNPGENWVGIAGVIFVGLFWCLTLKRTGSLWFAVGMHAAFDFGETFIFSVPDSGMIFPGHLSNATISGPTWITGGTPGPEASVFDFLIIAVFFFVFDRLYPPKQERSYIPPTVQEN